MLSTQGTRGKREGWTERKKEKKERKENHIAAKSASVSSSIIISPFHGLILN